jgi:hypothetical protein
MWAAPRHVTHGGRRGQEEGWETARPVAEQLTTGTTTLPAAAAYQRRIQPVPAVGHLLHNADRHLSLCLYSCCFFFFGKKVVCKCSLCTGSFPSFWEVYIPSVLYVYATQ